MNFNSAILSYLENSLKKHIPSHGLVFSKVSSRLPLRILFSYLGLWAMFSKTSTRQVEAYAFYFGDVDHI